MKIINIPIKISLLINLLIFLCLLRPIFSQFLPQRLSIVDSNKQRTNFLIRGNLPLNNTKFQMKQLKQSLESITGLKPKKYNLIVVNLLNCLTAKQTRSKYLQEHYFQKHREYEYIANPVLGSFINPKSVPNALRDVILPFYEYLSIDNLTNLLQLFRNYLSSSKPTIVYFHCSQGVDRTGYVHAVYSMKYQNKTLEQAYKYNLNVLKNYRKYMHYNTYYGIQWYCLYLGKSEEECLKSLQNY